MLWLSECTDVPVIVKGNGKLVGYVKNVYFDKIRRIFVYFGIETENGGHLFLPVSAASPKQALLLDEEIYAMLQEDADVSELSPSLLGLPAYNLSGIKKGEVLDAKFSGSGELNRLILSDGDIPPSQIACIGDVVLVKNAKPSSRIPRPKKDYPVQVLQDASNSGSAQTPEQSGESVPSPYDVRDFGSPVPDTALHEGHVITKNIAPNGDSLHQIAGTGIQETNRPPLGAVAMPAYVIAPPAPAIALGKGEPLFSQGALNAVLDGDSAFSGNDSHTPTRIICDYEFLLGRTLGSDLLSYMGELLAPKGALITAHVVELARAHGKLVDLTLNSIKQKP